MQATEIYNNIVGIVSKHAQNKLALASIGNGTNILNDLQVNSARLVDIVLDFEDKFNIQISDDEADRINTIGDAVALVQRLV